MKSMAYGTTLIVALALALPASAQQKPGPRRPSMPLAGVITNPDWLVKPNGDDMSRVYPPIAMMLGLPGQINMKCKVNEAGAVEDCSILSERPVGIGFGQAGIQLSGLFRMKPQTIDGAPVGGAEVTIPINFAMAEGQAPPAPPATGAALSDKAKELGRRLVVALGLGQALDQLIAQQILQLKQREYAASSGADAAGQEPAIRAFADAFQAKHDVMLDRLGDAYASQFTEDELVQLVAHFESPMQKLMTSKQAALSQSYGTVMTGLYGDITADARQRFCEKANCLAVNIPPPAQGAKP